MWLYVDPDPARRQQLNDLRPVPLEPILTAQLNLLSRRDRAWESQEAQEAWSAGSFWEGITRPPFRPTHI